MKPKKLSLLKNILIIISMILIIIIFYIIYNKKECPTLECKCDCEKTK